MSNIFLQVLISTVTFIISTADELQEVQFFSLLACDRKEVMTQLLLLGKFEYTGGPIFKVVLEC